MAPFVYNKDAMLEFTAIRGLLRFLERIRGVSQAMKASGGIEVVDIRAEIFGIDRPPLQNGLTYKGRKGIVPNNLRDSIVLHQTAVEFGVSKSSVRSWHSMLEKTASDKTEEDLWEKARLAAYWSRFWRVPYHFIALRTGTVLYVNDVSLHTYHAGKANRRSIGVAIEAFMPGLEKDRKKKHSAPTLSLLDAARAAMRKALEEAKMKGYPIENVYAHRQFSRNRAADPGEWAWMNIARVFAESNNLSLPEGESYYGGRPIPDEWKVGSVKVLGA